MNRKGYVINYDGNGSIFVDETAFLTAVEYLQTEGERIKETYWIELSVEEQVLPVLDSSSFGYMIGYGDPAVEEDDITNIFVPQNDLKATCDNLHEKGYKVWGFDWACPVIDRMKGAQKHMNNLYHNGGATEEQLVRLRKPAMHLLIRWRKSLPPMKGNCAMNEFATKEQLADLKSLCEEIKRADSIQGGFIGQIEKKTDDYTCITAAACTTLCNNLSEILLRIEDTYRTIADLTARKAE